MTTEQPDKKIRISTQNDQYPMGDPIPLVIRYINLSHEPISFREPAKTWEVMLGVRSAGKEEQQSPFGKIFLYKGDGYERTTIEEAEQITLGAGESYQFEVDVNQRWPELFGPGRHELRIIDHSIDGDAVVSNTITLGVLFTQNTFDGLLRMAGDDQATLEARHFAVEWVQKFHPEFQLHLKDPTAMEKETDENLIKTVQEWWKDNCHSQHIEAKITEINKNIQ